MKQERNGPKTTYIIYIIWELLPLLNQQVMNPATKINSFVMDRKLF